MAERSSRSFPAKSGAPHAQPASRDESVAGARVALREGPARAQPPLVMVPLAAADEVAQMALFLRAEAEAKATVIHCDACDATIVGEPSGSGLYLWTRGADDVRFEEPPLCESCATAIGTTALRRWDEEDDEEG